MLTLFIFSGQRSRQQQNAPDVSQPTNRHKACLRRKAASRLSQRATFVRGSGVVGKR